MPDRVFYKKRPIPNGNRALKFLSADFLVDSGKQIAVFTSLLKVAN